jgi:Tfp pilus assembly protein PilX
MENQGKSQNQVEGDEKAGCVAIIALAVVLIIGLIAMAL